MIPRSPLIDLLKLFIGLAQEILGMLEPDKGNDEGGDDSWIGLHY